MSVISGHSKPRVLMIAPAFAPYFFSEALVNSKLALAMLQDGWDVVVVTARGGGFVYAQAWQEPWGALQQVRREIVSPQEGGLLLKTARSARALFRTGHPVASALWAVSAAEVALRLHAERPFDAMLTRSTSCIAHLPGLLIKREADIPWIANWNDPPAFLKPDHYRDRISPWKRYAQMRYLRDAARRADWNTFPSQRLRDYMVAPLKISNTAHAVVVPHIGLELPGDALGAPLAPGKKDFTVTHAGNLLPEHEPRELFAAWARFVTKHPGVDLRMKIIGFCDKTVRRMANDFGIVDTIDFCEPMPFLDTLRALASSDAQLIVDTRHHGTLMLSKIPDYALVGRPIIAIAPSSSTTRDLMDAHRAGLWARNDSVDEIETVFERVFEQRNNGLLDGQSTEGLRDYTSPKRVAGTIKGLIERA